MIMIIIVIIMITIVMVMVEPLAKLMRNQLLVHAVIRHELLQVRDADKSTKTVR